MPLTRCPRSGQLYNSDEGPVHPDCMAEEEEDYERIHAYLREHPHASPTEAEAATGVDHDVLVRMVEQGMIKMLTKREAEEQRKRLSERELQRLNAKVAQEIASIKLPQKKDVEFGGTVRSLIQNKRNTE